MVVLNGQLVFLRALEPEDLDFVFEIENDTTLWVLGDTQTPYSRFVIRQYLENAQLDVFEAKQLRLAICKTSSDIIGFIDVYEFDFKNRRAGIGIVIKDTANRQQGFGKEALDLLVNYCFSALHLHQVFAHIAEDNLPSLSLFKKNGFKKSGLLQDWNFNGKQFANVYVLQRINN